MCPAWTILRLPLETAQADKSEFRSNFVRVGKNRHVSFNRKLGAPRGGLSSLAVSRGATASMVTGSSVRGCCGWSATQPRSGFSAYEDSGRLHTAVETSGVDSGVLVNDTNRAGTRVGRHQSLPSHEVGTGLDRNNAIRHCVEGHLVTDTGNPTSAQHRHRVNHSNHLRCGGGAIVV